MKRVSVWFGIVSVFGAVALFAGTGHAQKEGGSATPRVCKTPADLRQACQEFLQDQNLPYHMPDWPSDDDKLFIVDYLGSNDHALQSEAVDILVEMFCRWHHVIRASAFTKYLSRDWPIDVRLLAATYVNRGHMTEEMRTSLIKEGHEPDSYYITRFAKEIVAVVTDAARTAVTPRCLGLSLSLPDTVICKVSRDAQGMLLRRWLALLPPRPVPPGYSEDTVFWGILHRCMLADVEVQQVVLPEWYRVVAEARSRRELYSLATRILSSGSHSGHLWEIVDLATQDSDPETAKMAQEFLKKEGHRRKQVVPPVGMHAQ